MKIPMGNFGNVVAEPERQAMRQTDNQIADAANKVGQAGTQLASQMLLEQRHQQEEMARAKGVNADLDHKIFVKNKTQDISDRVARGELAYKDAAATFREEISSQPIPFVEGLPLVYQDSLQRSFRRTVGDAEFTIGKAVEGAQRAEFKGQFGATIDKLGKLAGMPNADIEKINADAELIRPLAKKAGIPDDVLSKQLQDLKDSNWTNHATQRAMGSRDNPELLQQLEKDLTDADGFYSHKLDTNKRNSVLRGVINDRMRIENKALHEIDRREAKAGKVIEEVDRQISSGIPMKSEDALVWEAKVKGTSHEGDLQQRIKEEGQIQQVLRQPIEQQKAFVQQKEAALLNGGGNLRDQANVNRLKKAVESNLQQLQNAPLLFAQNRNGQAAEMLPLDLQSFLAPDGASKLSNQLAERLATVSALQKQYGPQVKTHVLLPQEVEFISKGLDHATTNQQATLFGTLRASFNDDSAYMAAMQQLAPDSPIKAMAGAIKAKQRGITLERKWFGTDSVASSTDVADTLLVGDSIVNKSKSQKAEDGAGKSMYLPPRNAFNTAFAGVVGNLYRNGRSSDQEIDLQAAYTYYVGRASQTGRLTSSPTDIDSNLVKESLAATVGEPINFNARGMVTAPWGMSQERFKANMSSSFVKAISESGLPGALAYQFENYGLAHYRGSTYMPTMGGAPLLNPKTMKPIVLDAGDSAIDPGMKVPK